MTQPATQAETGTTATDEIRSMIWSPPHLLPAPTAEELAAAMRDGLEARRYYRKSPPDQPEPPGPPPSAGHLAEMLAGERPPATPLADVSLPGAGVGGRAVRLVRRAVRRLLRPWLYYQSEVNAVRADQADRLARFDTAVFWYLEAMRAYVGGLTTHIQTLQREVFGEVLPGYLSANSRLNECFHDLYKLRQLLGPSGPDRNGVLPTGTPHVIEGLFLHTRLPAPPARVLTLAAAHALDLASLGYQVVSAGPVGVRHPELRATGAADRALPFADGSFDLVVTLAGDGMGAGAADPWTASGGPLRAELARLVMPGGSVIGSVRVEDDAPAPVEVAALVAPFRLVELAYATRAGDGWALHPEPAAGCDAILWVAVR